MTFKYSFYWTIYKTFTEY